MGVLGVIWHAVLMYIRTKKNKSGSISIHIVEKCRGVRRLVESVGVARDNTEVGILKLKARYRIDDLSKQQQLPLVTKTDDIITSYLENLASPEIKNVGPELVLGKIFDSMGLNKVAEEMFRHVTLARLVYPVSKLKTVEYLEYHHGISVTISSVYRFLDKFYKDYKGEVERIIYEHSKKMLGKVKIVFYDMTTLYFEAEDEDDLRKIGFSKDGKFRNPQIMFGLLVGLDGYPIGYDVFEGNKFEGHTLIPILDNVQNKYGLEKPVVVADSGLLSKDNITNLKRKDYKFIIGARIKNMKKEAADKILLHAKGLKDGKSVKIKWEDGNYLIISYSNQRAKKDKHNRDKAIQNLRKAIEGGKLTKQSINNRGYNKFLTIENEIKVSLNEDKIEEESVWDGLKGYITNTKLAKHKVIEQYNELWKIEQAFRISKTDLRIRPIFHRKRDRIEAHLCIAFVAYAMYKELERKLKVEQIDLSAARAIELSKTIYQISFSLPDSRKNVTIFNNLSKNQKKLLEIT